MSNTNVIYESLVDHARRAMIRARCTGNVSDLKEAQGAIAKARSLKREQFENRKLSPAMVSYGNCIMQEYEAEKRLSRSGNTQKHLRNASALLDDYQRVMQGAIDQARRFEYCTML